MRKQLQRAKPIHEHRCQRSSRRGCSTTTWPWRGRLQRRSCSSVHRTRGQATRNLARGATQFASTGDHRRCRLCRLGTGDIGGSSRSTQIWRGYRSARNKGRCGHCAGLRGPVPSSLMRCCEGKGLQGGWDQSWHEACFSQVRPRSRISPWIEVLLLPVYGAVSLHSLRP